MTIDDILKLADQLFREGHQPTTALVKTRLPQPVPMAMLIQAMQKWKSQPHTEDDEAETISAVESSCEPILSTGENPDSAVMNELAALRTEIEQLKARISLLESNAR